jgi:hypothetical protein
MIMSQNALRGMRKTVLIGMAAFLGISAVPGFAQILSRGDLFGPGALPPTVGVELGLGLHREQGNFQAICNCTFEDGTGSGLLAALTFNLPLDYEWSIGLKAGIDFKNFATEAFIVDITSIRYESNDSVGQGRIRYRRDGDVSATYLTVAPAVKYQFFRGGPFVQAAAGISFLMSSKFVHKRELTSTTAELLDSSGTVLGQITDVTFQKTGTREETLEDGEITNVKGLRLGILLTGGYDIPISDKAILSPMLTYDLPLSTVRDDRAEDWKISSLLLSVGLKYLLD